MERRELVDLGAYAGLYVRAKGFGRGAGGPDADAAAAAAGLLHVTLEEAGRPGVVWAAAMGLDGAGSLAEAFLPFETFLPFRPGPRGWRRAGGAGARAERPLDPRKVASVGLMFNAELAAPLGPPFGGPGADFRVALDSLEAVTRGALLGSRAVPGRTSHLGQGCAAAADGADGADRADGEGGPSEGPGRGRQCAAGLRCARVTPGVQWQLPELRDVLARGGGGGGGGGHCVPQCALASDGGVCMDQEELYASVAGEMGEGERAGLRGAIDRGEDLDGLLASHLQRWYFNTKTARCEPFQYSGCRGNANNFRSAAACERASRACGRTLERAATQPKGAADAGEGPGRLHRTLGACQRPDLDTVERDNCAAGVYFALKRLAGDGGPGIVSEVILAGIEASETLQSQERAHGVLRATANLVLTLESRHAARQGRPYVHVRAVSADDFRDSQEEICRTHPVACTALRRLSEVAAAALEQHEDQHEL